MFTLKDIERCKQIFLRLLTTYLTSLSQSTYIHKMLKRFSIDQLKKGFLHIQYEITLSRNIYVNAPVEIDSIQKIPYVSAMESIIYIMLCTRSDASYALSVMSRCRLILARVTG